MCKSIKSAKTVNHLLEMAFFQEKIVKIFWRVLESLFFKIPCFSTTILSTNLLKISHLPTFIKNKLNRNKRDLDIWELEVMKGYARIKYLL